MNKALNLTCATLILSGCATTTIDTTKTVDFRTNQKYKQTLVKANVMPSKELMAGKSVRVVVIPTESQSALANKSDSNVALNNKLNILLQKAGIEIVDRSFGEKVTEELIAYEATGQYSESALNVADIALQTSISSATFSHEFTEAHTAKNIFTGKDVWVNASCEFKAKVQGSARSFTLPKLKLRNQVELKGIATLSRDTRNSSCHLSTLETYGLVNEAAQVAVTSYRVAIQNAFAPKAFVKSYRIFEDEHYIEVSIGTDREVDNGDEISFIRLIEVTDDLTGEVTTDELPLGVGEVTNILQRKSSWVKVDAELAKNIHLGDMAVVKYSKTFSESISGLSQAIKDI
jgi:hypothetical protein